ncbi:MAG: hypothetical protein WBA91_04635, partial [Paracoccaceae bacterium]
LWPGHSATEALINTVNLSASLQFDMLGWSVGSLALILAFVLWQKPSRADLLMGVVITAVLGATFFYWYADSYFIGPRYWFLAAFPLFFLSARGYQALRTRFAADDAPCGLRIDGLLWLVCLFGLCVFLPWRAVTKYYEYNNFHPELREAAANGQFDDAVVLVARGNADTGSYLMLNDPWLRGTIFLDDAGNLDAAAIAAAFPDRKIIRYTFDASGG